MSVTVFHDVESFIKKDEEYCRNLQNQSEEITELDDENFNWLKFISRIIIIILLICIIASFALGSINDRFFNLAALIGGVLLLVFICSFYDAPCANKRKTMIYGRSDFYVHQDSQLQDPLNLESQ
jgi:hypothetical protein